MKALRLALALLLAAGSLAACSGTASPTLPPVEASFDGHTLGSGGGTPPPPPPGETTTEDGAGHTLGSGG